MTNRVNASSSVCVGMIHTLGIKNEFIALENR